MSVKAAVLDRYTSGAQEVQASLCCPVDYDSGLLAKLPQEIIDKDYGCGDPSRYVQPGDTVLDLGSGGGKICYMAAQLVGSAGKVIGIDMNDDMLALARRYQQEMAETLGYDCVTFIKGTIQDLALDLDALEHWLSLNPVKTTADYHLLHDWQAQQRKASPLIADNSIDLIISNCVLNLVHDTEKQQMIDEIFRVLKPGGRIAIADIVSDEPTPEKLKQDSTLWSGCISGAFQEQAFIAAFVSAGFQAVSIDKWDTNPWQVIDNIEYRSVTVTAIKGDTSPCLDIGHAVIYRGPFAEIQDDEGHRFPRGERMAVCERTYEQLMSGVYRDHFIGITPAQTMDPRPWCAASGTRRPASQSKASHHINQYSTESCC